MQTVHIKASSVRKPRLPAVTPGMRSSLLVRRPDIRTAEDSLLAADFNVEVARKAFLPTISLTGAAGFQSAPLKTLLRPESTVFDIAAGLTQPIFDGGRLGGAWRRLGGARDRSVTKLIRPVREVGCQSDQLQACRN